jgi:hypothetical protein
MKKIILVTLIFCTLVGCTSPEPAPTPIPSETATQVVPTATQTPSPTVTPSPTMETYAGLGVSRADGAQMFQFFEFAFELGNDEEGIEAYIGTISDNLAEIRLYGSQEEIYQATIVIWVPKPSSQNQAGRTMTYLATMLTVFADEWEEGTAWLNISLNKTGETKAEFGNKQVILNLTPSESLMTVEFTIRGMIIK